MWSLPLSLLIAIPGIAMDSPPHPTIPADPLAGSVRRDDRERFLRGLDEAESFRQTLVSRVLDGQSYAYRLGETIADFAERSAGPLADRPGIGRFTLRPADYEQRIRGTGRRIDVDEAFAPFAGRWYGLWKSNRVDHDWSRVVTHEPARAEESLPSVRIRATQSAWVGDGFGWNVVVNPETEPTSEVILGTVYHVEPGEPDRIRFHLPLAGVDAGQDRLVWITASEVFLEEVIRGDTDEESRYVITGFRYALQDARIEFDGAGFQAIYTRDPDRRPEWYSFSITSD